MRSNLLSLACLIPGAVILLSGALVAFLGFLSNQRQLKVDTGLERGSVIRFGLAGLGIGVLLVIIPLGIWLLFPK